MTPEDFTKASAEDELVDAIILAAGGPHPSPPIGPGMTPKHKPTTKTIPGEGEVQACERCQDRWPCTLADPRLLPGWDGVDRILHDHQPWPDGTPTGEPADMCPDCEEYWPCDYADPTLTGPSAPRDPNAPWGTVPPDYDPWGTGQKNDNNKGWMTL